MRRFSLCLLGITFLLTLTHCGQREVNPTNDNEVSAADIDVILERTKDLSESEIYYRVNAKIVALQRATDERIWDKLNEKLQIERRNQLLTIRRKNL